MSLNIALFTDLHYGDTVENKGNKNGINTFGNIKEEILSLHKAIKSENPDLTVNLGDLVMNKNSSIRETLLSSTYNLFNDLKIYHLFGNHEINNFPIKKLETLSKNKSFQTIIKGNMQFIFINSKKVNKHYILHPEDLENLKQLVHKNNYKSIIFSHFPISLDSENISYYHKELPHKSFLYNSKEIQDTLKDSNCIAFISGHTHFHFERTIDNIRHITIPSFSEEKLNRPSTEYTILNIPSLKIKIKNLH